MKKELNGKAPKWFKEWVNNHYWHLALKVDILLWIVGVMAGAIIAKIVIDFFWS